MLSNRLKMLNDMKLDNLAQLPDEYLEVLYDHHNKKMDPDNKENLLLEFINTLFEINDASPISNIDMFTNIPRKNLLFEEVPKCLSDKIAKIYNIIIKEPDDDYSNCGSIYIKNMVKQLNNYEFANTRKDLFVKTGDIKKRKPFMVYAITKK